MNAETREEANAWLHKAQRDLDAAGILMDSAHRRSDIAVYHCQQAAEKAIKS
jgi:HEPN domain-containing protein